MLKAFCCKAILRVEYFLLWQPFSKTTVQVHALKLRYSDDFNEFQSILDAVNRCGFGFESAMATANQALGDETQVSLFLHRGGDFVGGYV